MRNERKYNAEKRIDMERTNYMMTVDDVAQELGVSKQKGYRIIRQLNEELAAAGYMTVQAKVPEHIGAESFIPEKEMRDRRA